MLLFPTDPSIYKNLFSINNTISIVHNTLHDKRSTTVYINCDSIQQDHALVKQKIS